MHSLTLSNDYYTGIMVVMTLFKTMTRFTIPHDTPTATDVA
jgi:hypothetical protein